MSDALTTTAARRAPRLLLGLTLLGATALALTSREHFDATLLQSWVTGAGPAGPLVFMLIYALAAVLLLPGSVITLAGGALFGPLWGTLWNLGGATLGAALAFLIARYLGADWVARRAGPRLTRLNEGVAAEGWRFIAFVRLVPLFPFNLLNYALGLTRISFGAYVLASWLFMLPGAVAYTWLGYAGREALAGGGDMVRNGLIALALLAATALLPRWIGQLRQPAMVEVDELKQQLDANADLLLLDVRSVAEYEGADGRIASARNLPVQTLAQRLDGLGAQYPIRLVCHTDRRSSQAARLLAAAGYTDARAVRGGMSAWRARGYPTTTRS